MKRSSAIIPITYVKETTDSFGDIWVETKELGKVYTDDVLELLNEMDKIWSEMHR